MKHLLGELIEIGDNKYVVTSVCESKDDNSLPRAKVEMWKLPNKQIQIEDIPQAEVQTITSDEIKQIIDNTTEKTNYGLYLETNLEKEFLNNPEKAFINIIETLLDICKIDAVKRVHSGILMTNITKSEATILRDKIFIAWGHNCTIGIGVLPMDEIQKLSDKRLLKKKTAIKDATFGLYLTCHNEPQFKEAYKQQFQSLMFRYNTCVDIEGPLYTSEDVEVLNVAQRNITKRWRSDYKLTFEIKPTKRW